MTIVKKPLSELSASSKEELKKLETLSDEDIDYSDIPELDARFWKEATLVEPDRSE